MALNALNIDNRINNAPYFAGGNTRVVSSKLARRIEHIGEKWSTPHNRFFLGVTALCMQPWIDLYNKDVDEDTRKVACARTIAKNVVGTLTGMAVRQACISSIDAFTKTEKELEGKTPSKWAKLLIPTQTKDKAGEIVELSHKEFSEALRLVKKHRQTLGSLIALGVMLITNFALDVPLTKLMTNYLTDNHFKISKKESDKKGGK